MPITILDLVLLGVMLISGLLAMVRGFMREILSIAAWRTTRPRRYVVRVQREGRTVEVRTDDEAELRTLAEELEGAIDSRPGAD